MIGESINSAKKSASIDSDQVRKNYLDKLITFELALILGLLFISNFILRHGLFKTPFDYGVILSSLSVVLVTKYILNQGSIKLAGYFNFSFFWLEISIFTISYSGFVNPVLPLIFVLVYLSYMVLGEKGGKIYTLLTLLAIPLIGLNSKYEFIRHIKLTFDPLLMMTVYLAVLIVLTLLAMNSSQILENSIETAKNKELRNRELVEELEAAQEQINQSQKMDAIARLAGGLAHDFNNLLTAIIGHIELSLQEESLGEIYQNLILMKSTAEKASVLSRELLTFSRHRLLESKVCDLNEIVEKNKSFTRTLLKPGITIKYYLSPELNKIALDIEKFEQCYYNLLLNANEAMSQQGTIVISTFNKAILGTKSSAASYSCISIKDTGKGIKPVDMKHIFEPFFTTKDAGNGVGLATVYAFVTQSEGTIKVNSEPDAGTEFTLQFPAAESSGIIPTADSENELIEVLNNSSQKSNYRVVLVDDEEMIVDVFEKYLKKKDIDVTSFFSPISALEYLENDDSIDLVITDQVMPGMNGLDLIQKIIEIRPEMKFLVISGYIDDLSAMQSLDPDLLDRNHIDFMYKPFELEFLLNKVRSLIKK